MTRKRAKSASPEWFGRLRMPEATGAPPFGFRGTEKTATFYSGRGHLENVGLGFLSLWPMVEALASFGTLETLNNMVSIGGVTTAKRPQRARKARRASLSLASWISGGRALMTSASFFPV